MKKKDNRTFLNDYSFNKNSVCNIDMVLSGKYLDDRKNIKDNPSKDYEDLMRIIKMNTYDENKNLLCSTEIIVFPCSLFKFFNKG